MNWIVCVAYNGYEMTCEAIESFLSQDVGNVRVWVLDNASTESMFDKIRHEYPDIWFTRGRKRYSVAFVWNTAINGIVASKSKSNHVLVCNNDIILRPDTYRLLLEDGGDFVTPVGCRERESIYTHELRPHDRRPHPDFSCFLIRKHVWDTVGEFDETFEGAYCEDGDYHCRMHQAGIHAYSIGVPFYHRVSGTKAANPHEAAAIDQQADRNRAYFRKKWGFSQGDADYCRFFGVSEEEYMPIQLGES